jgi:mRNA interferase YafQ
MPRLKGIMVRLARQERLPLKYRDHRLAGNYKGRRECHVEPDWLLIYKTTTDTIVFERTGRHADLFG